MATITTSSSLVRRELFIFDASVANLSTLLSVLPATSDYFVLDSTYDGVAQIADLLAKQTDIDSLHIFSHGSVGSLQLGNSSLLLANMNDYAVQLSHIGSSLSSTGDILLYGCNVGAGDVGQQFVNTLAQLTGADVAASDDLTGAAALGGDWELEVQSGTVESSPIAVAGFEGVLANTAPTGTVSINGIAKQGEKLTVITTYAPEYAVTKQTYSLNADLTLAAQSEYGINASVAEWTTIKTLYGNSVESIQDFMDTVGIELQSQPSLNNYFVTYNGDSWNGIRHYFVSRHDGNEDLSYLYHDEIQGYQLGLGSYTYAANKILVQINNTNLLYDADGLGVFSYQWYADDKEIIGATSSTFILTEAEVASKIYVVVSYTDGNGTLESVASLATNAVTPINAPNHHDLTGNITFWKTGEALSDVHVNIMPTATIGTEHLIEFKNIQLHADGSRTVEIWKAATPSEVENVDFELELQAGSTATWQSMFPNGWLSADGAEGNFFSVQAAGLGAPLSANAVQLGVLTLTQPTNTQSFSLSLVDGIVGSEEATPFTLHSEQTVSDAAGNYFFTNLQESSYTLSANKEYNTLHDAVTSADALAVLKIAVGLTPNEDGSAILPYQYLAADVNHDGRVRSTDALAILKMAVGYESAPENSWIFVAEDDVLATSMSRKAVDWSVEKIDVTLDSNLAVNLIGIVKGDIDGSWGSWGMVG